MWHGSVKIESPDVIKEFRVHYIKFDERCRSALAEIRSESQQVQQWLQHEQISNLKVELRKCEELLLQARYKYSQAKADSPAYGRNSAMDELKALRKAELRKEEAERKLQNAKKWVSLVEREANKLFAPINNLANALDVTTPKALAKLDQLTRDLEDYFRAAPPDVGTPRTPGGPANGS
ncbi:MAG: hypothetical protein ABSE73_21270 [Planctomycetota bacterium]